jgi:hypothetical protein
MVDDDPRQERVHAYVAEVMRVVSGIPYEEAATTLTVSVAAVMIAWTKDDKREREEMARHFARQLRETVARDDIVEWIKAHTTYVEPAGTQ